MIFILFLLFTVLPIAEISILIKVGQRIGLLNTVLLTIVISMTGAWLARLQGFLVLTKIQESLAKGIMPNKELLDGFLIFAGGVLLLTPGFITDSIGLLLLFPVTRSFVRLLLRKRFENMVKNGQAVNISTFGGQRPGNYDDIDIN